VPILPWLGTALILAALGTYVWLTARSTSRVQLPPRPIPTELQEVLVWMREQMEEQINWERKNLERAFFREKDPQSEGSSLSSPLSDFDGEVKSAGER
jgi:hypothetical protein